MPKKKKATNVHVVLVGGKGVGKYSLREQFLKGWIAPKDFQAPPGPNGKALVIEKTKVEVTVSILKELNKEDEELRKCHGIILVYNISEKNSLEYVRNEAVPFLRDALPSKSDTDPANGEPSNTEGSASAAIEKPVILVGNKADEAKLSRKVDENDGQKLSEEIKSLGFFETSATCNENVPKAFECLVKHALEKAVLDNPPKEKEKQKKSRCVIS